MEKTTLKSTINTSREGQSLARTASDHFEKVAKLIENPDGLYAKLEKEGGGSSKNFVDFLKKCSTSLSSFDQAYSKVTNKIDQFTELTDKLLEKIVGGSIEYFFYDIPASVHVARFGKKFDAEAQSLEEKYALFQEMQTKKNSILFLPTMIDGLSDLREFSKYSVRSTLDIDIPVMEYFDIASKDLNEDLKKATKYGDKESVNKIKLDQDKLQKAQSLYSDEIKERFEGYKKAVVRFSEELKTFDYTEGQRSEVIDCIISTVDEMDTLGIKIGRSTGEIPDNLDSVYSEKIDNLKKQIRQAIRDRQEQLLDEKLLPELEKTAESRKHYQSTLTKVGNKTVSSPLDVVQAKADSNLGKDSNLRKLADSAVDTREKKILSSAKSLTSSGNLNTMQQKISEKNITQSLTEKIEKQPTLDKWTQYSWEFSEGLMSASVYANLLEESLKGLNEGSEEFRKKFTELQGLKVNEVQATLAELTNQHELGNISDTEYETALNGIISQYERYPKVLALASEALNEFNEKNKTTGDILQNQLAEALKQTTQQFEELGGRSLLGVVDGFLEASIRGGDFGETLKRLGEDILYTTLRMILLQQMTRFLSNVFGGGGGGGAVSPAWGNNFPGFGNDWTIGNDDPWLKSSVGNFSATPDLFTSTAGLGFLDDSAAGMPLMSGAMGSVNPNVTINVENRTSTPIRSENAGISYDSVGGMVTKVILEDVASMGPISRTLRR